MMCCWTISYNLYSQLIVKAEIKIPKENSLVSPIYTIPLTKNIFANAPIEGTNGEKYFKFFNCWEGKADFGGK